MEAQFSVLKQTADPAVADAIARLIETRRRPRTQPHQCAGFFQAHRARRRAGDLRLPACLAARPVRSHLERALPRMQRRARRPSTLKSLRTTTIIADFAPAAMSLPSTSRSRSPSRSAPGSGASRRMIRTRCRCGNISSRCSGVRGSISTRTRSTSLDRGGGAGRA